MRIHKRGKSNGLLLIFLCSAWYCGFSQNTPHNNHISVSAIKGTLSRPDTIHYESEVKKTKLQGDQASYFLVKELNSDKRAFTVQFSPPSDFIGIAKANLVINNKKNISLAGLSTKGMEGENEAPLATVLDALGYTTNVGWETLSNPVQSGLQGEEIPLSLFEKAEEGDVQMIPIARYSPDFPLQFGYFTNDQFGPKRYHTGIFGKSSGIS